MPLKNLIGHNSHFFVFENLIKKYIQYNLEKPASSGPRLNRILANSGFLKEYKKYFRYAYGISNLEVQFSRQISPIFRLSSNFSKYRQLCDFIYFQLFNNLITVSTFIPIEIQSPVVSDPTMTH